MALILSLALIVCGCLYATAVRKKIAHSGTAKQRLSWTLPALALFAVAPVLISTEEVLTLSPITEKVASNGPDCRNRPTS